MAAALRPSAMVIISASQVLHGIESESRAKIQGRAAIIGVNWSERSKGSGILVDSYDTPVGREQGVYLHASYSEALISDRAYRLAPSPWPTLMKFASILILGVVNVIAESGWTNVAWIVSVLMVNLGAAYVLFTNVGLAADAA
jgi:hypothetical protein